MQDVDRPFEPNEMPGLGWPMDDWVVMGKEFQALRSAIRDKSKELARTFDEMYRDGIGIEAIIRKLRIPIRWNGEVIWWDDDPTSRLCQSAAIINQEREHGNSADDQ